jgi:hypothetical protein
VDTARLQRSIDMVREAFGIERAPRGLGHLRSEVPAARLRDARLMATRLPTRHWQDLPWPAFRDLPANTVAVLPVASIEQHGPHLPVSVDTTTSGSAWSRARWR